ncbi:MAG: hypothetical protein V5A84_04350 [Planctomycetota bacterium]
MMNARLDRKGLSLVEILGYMALFALLSSLMVPILMRALDLCSATAQSTRISRASQAALEHMCRDVRCASEIELNAVELPSGTAPIRLRLPDGTAVVYAITGSSFTRIRIPEDENLPSGEKPPAMWTDAPVTGKFADLKVTRVPQADRVYRITLTAQVRRGPAKKYGKAPFTTAVQMRREPE